MFACCTQTKLQWRLRAVYHPVAVAGVAVANQDGSDRCQILQTCHEGMRVVLRREPDNCGDPHAIALFVHGGREIGQLPADVAVWVAPLLDSGRVAFDSEIWSLERVARDNGPEEIVCRLTLRQHELVPVRRISLAALADAVKRLFRRSGSALSAPARSAGAALRSLLLKADALLFRSVRNSRLWCNVCWGIITLLVLWGMTAALSAFTSQAPTVFPSSAVQR